MNQNYRYNCVIHFYIHLFQLRSNVFKLFDLIIRFLNMFAQTSPDIPFQSNFKTCKVSFESPIALVRDDKALRKRKRL